MKNEKSVIRIKKLRNLFFLAPFLLGSCHFATKPQSNPTPVPPTIENYAPMPEDSVISGYHVRSYFNAGAGKEWKVVYGDGLLLQDSLLRDDSIQFFTASSSMRMVASDLKSTVIEKILTTPENVCGDVFMSLKLMAEQKENLSHIQVLSLSLIGGKNYIDSANGEFQHQIQDSLLIAPEQWTRINMVIGTFKRSPTFDCHKVERVRIRFAAKPGFHDTLRFGELAFYPSPLSKAALIITEDDQWASFDTNGVPALQKYGFPASIYANCGLLGAFNKMTLVRLKTLQDSGGWTIANHLWLHDTITTLSDDSATRSIQHNSEFMQANGLKGDKYFAYPYGIYNRAKDAIVRKNSENARLVTGWSEGEALPYFDRYHLRVVGFLEKKVTLEMAKVGIDRLVSNKTAGILGVHEIILTKTGDRNELDTRKWFKSDWEALIDHIKAKVDQGVLKLYTLDDYMKEVRNYTIQQPRPARVKSLVP